MRPFNTIPICTQEPITSPSQSSIYQKRFCSWLAELCSLQAYCLALFLRQSPLNSLAHCIRCLHTPVMSETRSCCPCSAFRISFGGGAHGGIVQVFREDDMLFHTGKMILTLAAIRLHIDRLHVFHSYSAHVHR